MSYKLAINQRAATYLLLFPCIHLCALPPTFLTLFFSCLSSTPLHSYPLSPFLGFFHVECLPTHPVSPLQPLVLFITSYSVSILSFPHSSLTKLKVILTPPFNPTLLLLLLLPPHLKKNKRKIRKTTCNPEMGWGAAEGGGTRVMDEERVGREEGRYWRWAG